MPHLPGERVAQLLLQRLVRVLAAELPVAKRVASTLTRWVNAEAPHRVSGGCCRGEDLWSWGWTWAWTWAWVWDMDVNV